MGCPGQCESNTNTVCPLNPPYWQKSTRDCWWLEVLGLFIFVPGFIRSRDPCHKSFLTCNRVVKNITKIHKSHYFYDIFIIGTRVVMFSRVSVFQKGKCNQGKIILCRNPERGRQRASNVRRYRFDWLHSLVCILHLSKYLHLASELFFPRGFLFACLFLFSRSMNSMNSGFGNIRENRKNVKN